MPLFVVTGKRIQIGLELDLILVVHLIFGFDKRNFARLRFDGVGNQPRNIIRI